ncbi:CubicO group peptidase (beta-lactamase class C family) [Murinocardiopsis flavida]|uniref:CubicO group peptidase (Beta-lactamase class C family) n=1 Tax=Murinocardiopsis flavida TaxID=645275 RepID=A0A2P8DGJ5_9ACTN|nr:serine hydrolase domain-containing protein [Murinocardiopsis flavida]PSK96331.1 CubicO group peptidase (beta-lactamase class C family) [Murinocardiopsis flavida]
MALSRRGFGKLAGTAGLGTALAGTVAAPAPAAARTWHMGGTAVPALKGFDATLKKFMQDRDIPGGQIAVTYKGRLVLARSYAWTADPTLRFGPTALFRTASLSKPVTAAAVNVLVRRGKLKLATPVTEILDLEPPSGQTADARLPKITVQRLLQHLGGWDRDVSGDITTKDADVAKVLGVELPVSEKQVVTYGAGKALDNAPGAAYAYSNYGYLLLGQIIEKVTGESYEAFVKREVLKPVGIDRMRLARSLKEQAAPTEVPYFSQYKGTTVLDPSGAKVAAPYGTIRLETRDSGGAWLASAADLVRFASIFDSADSGVLDAAAIKRTFATPETGVGSGGSYYGMGWHVRPVSGGTGRNTWHTGSLPGTSTLLVRTSQNMSWAVLFNQRDDPSGLSYTSIDGAMWDAVRGVGSWPSHDLFPKYF